MSDSAQVEYSSFNTYLESLLERDTTVAKKDLRAALDGLGRMRAAELIPLQTRRADGIFFTPALLGRRLARRLASSFDSQSVVVDPACGAGDLLIACASRLLATQLPTSPSWQTRFIGWDIHSDFIRAARLRLLLWSRLYGADVSQPSLETAFPCLEVASVFDRVSEVPSATHIVMNPPYSSMRASDGCNYASGAVNAAAVIVRKCLDAATEGTRMAAILPDVLRSGSRYDRWRAQVEEMSDVNAVTLVGKFDADVDVDVFLLDLRRRSRGGRAVQWIPPRGVSTLGDHFKVSVGAVVNNRDPHSGPWRPFLMPRDASMKSSKEVRRSRRFKGKVVAPPFVVVNRTSSPAEAIRARSILVNTRQAVAVDNHFIVLEPRGGGVSACRKAMKILSSPSTSEWLNQRIRCRHLTVSSVAAIPWPDPDNG